MIRIYLFFFFFCLFFFFFKQKTAYDIVDCDWSSDVCFKQKTAYEIVDCDWSSDVCSSDLNKILLTTDQSAHYIQANGYWVDVIGNQAEVFRVFGGVGGTSEYLRIDGSGNVGDRKSVV